LRPALIRLRRGRGIRDGRLASRPRCARRNEPYRVWNQRVWRCTHIPGGVHCGKKRRGAPGNWFSADSLRPRRPAEAELIRDLKESHPARGRLLGENGLACGGPGVLKRVDSTDRVTESTSLPKKDPPHPPEFIAERGGRDEPRSCAKGSRGPGPISFFFQAGFG